jgi:hypothetical protein
MERRFLNIVKLMHTTRLPIMAINIKSAREKAFTIPLVVKPSTLFIAGLFAPKVAFVVVVIFEARFAIVKFISKNKIEKDLKFVYIN